MARRGVDRELPGISPQSQIRSGPCVYWSLTFCTMALVPVWILELIRKFLISSQLAACSVIWRSFKTTKLETLRFRCRKRGSSLARSSVGSATADGGRAEHNKARGAMRGSRVACLLGRRPRRACADFRSRCYLHCLLYLLLFCLVVIALQV